MSLTTALHAMRRAPPVENRASVISLPARSFPAASYPGTPETTARKLSAVDRCIELLSDSVAKLPSYILDTTTRERPRHPILELLNTRPNEAMTPFVHKKVLETSRLEGGNAYEWIIRDQRTMQPVELVPVPWQLVQPWMDTEGRVWYNIINPRTGENLTVHGMDMCHFKGATRTTSVTRRVIPEASSLTIALENGEIDYIDSLNSIDIERIKANPKLKTVEMVSANIAYLGFNTTKEPFDDPLVRRALQYASNKEAIVEVLYEGYGIPCTSVFPTIGVAFNDELDMYTYDIDKAKELLTKAGHADGFSFEITVSSDIRSRAAQLLQQDFAQIGVTVDINQMEFGAMLDYLSGKNHEGWIMSWGGATNPNMTLTNNFHTESGGATGNRMWYSNPEVDRLIEEARAEMDADKRNEMYKEVQAILMEDSPWIPLLQQTYVAGMNKGLDGMIMYKTGSRYYHEAVVYED